MIVLRGYDGGTPTVRLTEELHRYAPELLTGGSPKHADLVVHPVNTQREPGATRGRWYTLHWGHPTVVAALDGGFDIEYDRGEEIGALGAPPRIPIVDRREALPPITLDGFSPAEITMWGGEDELRRILTRQREADLAHDTSVDAYDWATHAIRVIEAARDLTPPKLTTPQRAEVAAVRHLRALRELDAARASVAAQIRRGDDEDATDTGDWLLNYLDEVDPGHFTRRLPPPPSAVGVAGRPEVGAPVKVWMSPYLVERIDKRRRPTAGGRETRSAAARRVLDGALADLTTWEASRVDRRLRGQDQPDGPDELIEAFKELTTWEHKQTDREDD